jgi:hypothetical protein
MTRKLRDLTKFTIIMFGMLPFFSVGLSAPMEQERKKLMWDWSDERAALLYSTLNGLAGYDVRILRSKNKNQERLPFCVQVAGEGAQGYVFDAHSGTVFAQAGNTLYIAEFDPIAPGCQVAAIDLTEGKVVWRRELKGNLPVKNSKYSTDVNIAATDASIVIFRRESTGRYIEVLDGRTGKSVAYEALPVEK